MATSRHLIRELPLCQQPAQRLVRTGPGDLSVVELVAVLLHTPDALDGAQELVAHFGLTGLLHATPTELQAFRGVGPTRATQLVAALELGRRLLLHTEERAQIRSPGDASALVMPLLAKREQERMVVVLLDTKQYVFDTVWLYQGSLNSCVVRVAEVFREAVRRQAAAILVAHNHPSGSAEASAEDIRVTRELREAGKLLDIDLVDHLIIGDGRFLSMRDRGLGF